jgi:hypothetical protein
VLAEQEITGGHGALGIALAHIVEVNAAAFQVFAGLALWRSWSRR